MFSDMLKAAIGSGEALAAAVEGLAKARASEVEASAAYDAAVDAKARADRALHDYLAERGTHYSFAPDGTVTLYVACEAGPGWRADHPIPGNLPGDAGKAD